MLCCSWSRKKIVNGVRIGVYGIQIVGLYGVRIVGLQGMNIIEAMDPVGFSDYLKKYQNTICGHHPIGVLLNVSIDSSKK